MKLSKPEYNENVVDIDGLEKLRIQQEAETERKVIIEQELTKREAIVQKEQTKRNNKDIKNTAIIAIGLAIAVAAVAGACNTSQYLDVLKLKAQGSVASCPKCPELNCQPVPVNR